VVTALYPSRKSEVQLVKMPELYEHYVVVSFPMSGGRYLKALALRDHASSPDAEWGPGRYTPVPRERWQ
jgi:hypothetical protein